MKKSMIMATVLLFACVAQTFGDQASATEKKDQAEAWQSYYDQGTIDVSGVLSECFNDYWGTNPPNLFYRSSMALLPSSTLTSAERFYLEMLVDSYEGTYDAAENYNNFVKDQKDEVIGPLMILANISYQASNWVAAEAEYDDCIDRYTDLSPVFDDAEGASALAASTLVEMDAFLTQVNY